MCPTDSPKVLKADQAAPTVKNVIERQFYFFQKFYVKQIKLIAYRKTINTYESIYTMREEKDYI